jgi:7,8-dihydropterin-6-yl-methyl-4-(beta-D-ribofuranosyl)aminobenzene 5'-phosphate synthase
MLKITVLVENSVRKRHLAAEHGLSFWLELDDANILFDAGQSDVYLRNASRLGIDIGLKRIGLCSATGTTTMGTAFASSLLNAPAGRGFFAHPDAFAERFGHDMRQAGLSWQPDDLSGFTSRLMYNTGTMEIARDTCLCCRLPETDQHRRRVAGILIARTARCETDLFLDEQILTSRQRDGLVVICGCCHLGLLNALTCVRQLYPQEKNPGCNRWLSPRPGIGRAAGRPVPGAAGVRDRPPGPDALHRRTGLVPPESVFRRSLPVASNRRQHHVLNFSNRGVKPELRDAVFALHAKIHPVLFKNRLDDGQTQPGSQRTAAGLVEAFPDSAQFLGRNGGPGIADGNTASHG